MSVSEFITLWDSVNVSTIPFKYYYNGEEITKHKLYKINKPLQNIVIKCTEESLTEYDVIIYHKDNLDFDYDQQTFYDSLRLEIPDSARVNVIHMYIK